MKPDSGPTEIPNQKELEQLGYVILKDDNPIRAKLILEKIGPKAVLEIAFGVILGITGFLLFVKIATMVASLIG